MPLDADLPLVLGMQAQPGAYALLLGSGVSRASGMPGAWDVVNDLCKKVAEGQGASAPADPIAWYTETTGNPPDYSSLLDALAPSAAERAALLRPYFEPTDDERRDGLKQPTAAHKAIAQLVAGGWVRVILTTNFDRLIEDALVAANIRPTVIRSVDDITRAPPPMHSKCTIIKVHGDYLDTRTLNTTTELAAYDDLLAAYLRRVMGEFGLVSVGWSATWDHALRDVLTGTEAPYSTYFAVRGELSDEAKAVADAREARLISIEDSEAFLPALAGKVEALQAMAGNRELSESMLVSAVKRLIPHEQDRIQLHDKLAEEQRKLMEQIATFSTYPGVRDVEFLERARDLVSRSSRVRAAHAAIAFWAEPRHGALLVEGLLFLARVPKPTGTWNQALGSVRELPASLSLFTIGAVAVVRNNHVLLAQVLTESTPVGDGDTLAEALSPNMVMPKLVVPGPSANTETRVQPSRFVRDQLDAELATLLPDRSARLASIHRFEVVYGLHLLHLSRARGSNFTYFPSISWREEWGRRDSFSAIKDEITATGGDWPPLKAGLFSRNLAKLQETIAAYEALLARRGPFDTW